MARRYCLTLDLKDDPQLIAEYKRYHERIWSEITASLKASGIEDAEIYLLGRRMFMILDVNQDFSFQAKAKADRENPRVQEWEDLNVEIPATTPAGKTRPEMAFDG